MNQNAIKSNKIVVIVTRDFDTFNYLFLGNTNQQILNTKIMSKLPSHNELKCK